MLLPGTRFVNTRVWTIDINDYGSNFFEVYHVVSSTPNSILMIRATLFQGNVHADGNKLMDKLLEARASNTPILNESTTPRCYMLQNDDRGDYFVSDIMRQKVRLNGTYPVTYIAHGMADKVRRTRVSTRASGRASWRARSGSLPYTPGGSGVS